MLTGDLPSHLPQGPFCVRKVPPEAWKEGGWDQPLLRAGDAGSEWLQRRLQPRRQMLGESGPSCPWSRAACPGAQSLSPELATGVRSLHMAAPRAPLPSPLLPNPPLGSGATATRPWQVPCHSGLGARLSPGASGVMGSHEGPCHALRSREHLDRRFSQKPRGSPSATGPGAGARAGGAPAP